MVIEVLEIKKNHLLLPKILKITCVTNKLFLRTIINVSLNEHTETELILICVDKPLSNIFATDTDMRKSNFIV